MKPMKRFVKPIILSALLSGGAAADFRYEAPSEQLYKDAALFERRALAADSYSANQLPAHIVLKMIAGPDVEVDLGQDLDPNELMSFRGGRPRREILNELLSPKGFTWRYRDGTLIVRSAREVELGDVFNADLKAEDRFYRPVTWKIVAGVTLKQLIHEWARRERVAVDWRVKTPITIGAAGTIDGPFVNAIDQLLEGLGEDVPVVRARLNTVNDLLEVWELDEKF